MGGPRAFEARAAGFNSPGSLPAPHRLAVWIPGSHPGGRGSAPLGATIRGSRSIGRSSRLKIAKVSVRIRGAAPLAYPNRQRKQVESLSSERSNRSASTSFAPVAQHGRGAALRTRRFSVRIRAGVPLTEGAGVGSPNGPENRGTVMSRSSSMLTTLRQGQHSRNGFRACLLSNAFSKREFGSYPRLSAISPP